MKISKSTSIDELIENNKQWATDVVKEDPEYFARLKDVQKPEFLWIGCSDSRVPADRITGTHPGEIFVHRNIANMVIHTDMNLLAVLEYAVDHLNVNHIIVCGHYGCSGVKAAMSRHDYDLINKWIRNIKDVYVTHRNVIDFQTKPEERLNKLIELNVEEQVMNLAKTSIVQRSWKNKKTPEIHGWVYSLEDGLIKKTITMTYKDYMDPLYEFDDL
jgi:carbonic anhydrase